jgi:ADP-ribose pyrophosphatase YjhB (NUDIX family)
MMTVNDMMTMAERTMDTVFKQVEESLNIQGKTNFDEMGRLLAAAALNRIPQDKPLGTELFNAVAKHSVGIAHETVLVRRNKVGWLEVFLTQRGPNEAYPGAWHCPGTYLRAGERLPDVFARLSAREYGAKIVSAKFLTGQYMPEERYKTMDDKIFLVEVEGEPTTTHGRWFPTNELPDGTIDFHRDIVATGVRAFVKQESEGKQAPLVLQDSYTVKLD